MNMSLSEHGSKCYYMEVYIDDSIIIISFCIKFYPAIQILIFHVMMEDLSK